MKHKTVIFLAIGLAIMGVMLYFIGIDQVIDALKLANFWFILLAILIQFFIFFICMHFGGI